MDIKEDQLIYKVCDQKTGSRASAIEELAQELYKLVIRLLKYSKEGNHKFKDNILDGDLAEMRSLSSFNNVVT